MFFSMTNEWKAISKDEPIFEFESLDTVYDTQISHQVRLLSNSMGAPRLFFSEIETPVCADGVCQLAHINIYWNLLGKLVRWLPVRLILARSFDSFWIMPKRMPRL